MKKKTVIVIKEGLANVLAIFSSLEDKDLFKLKIINYLELFSGKYKDLLEENSVVNVILVINPEFYRTIAEELDEYLRKIFDTAFKNLLFLYTDADFLTENGVRNGSKHAFFLHDKDKSSYQANGLILYLLKAFNESIISFRLHDYIANSFQGVMDTELLKKKNEEIKRLNLELLRKNKIDSLTNLYNRATIFDFLEQERIRTIRDLWRMDKALKVQCNGSGPQTLLDTDCKPLGDILDHYGVLSLMLIDIDQFKNINDTYGHLQGDAVLRFLGELLHDKDIFRDNDLSGRWGGEEFLVILPDTNVKNAMEPAERFLKKLARKTFGDGQVKFKVTVSIGISQSRNEDESKEDIIRRSDTALYYAKGHGRNRIIVFEDLKK